MTRGCGLTICIFSVALLLMCSTRSIGAVRTREVKYLHGDLECHGYLAWDDQVKGPRPGVLVVHEWWGLNDYARGRARQLAELGYVALAADIYGEGKKAEHPKQAGEMATQIRANVQDWRARARAALETLKQQPECDSQKLAAIGYCFGGSTALQLAYSGAELRAVATFHAALPEPTAAEAQQIKSVILVNHGADDAFIPAEAIQKFRHRLDEAKVSYEFVAYPGVRHSFTVPDAGKHGIEGLKYDENADKESWKRLTDLLKKELG